jgi:hypothetical protein
VAIFVTSPFSWSRKPSAIFEGFLKLRRSCIRLWYFLLCLTLM